MGPNINTGRIPDAADSDAADSDAADSDAADSDTADSDAADSDAADSDTADSDTADSDTGSDAADSDTGSDTADSDIADSMYDSARAVQATRTLWRQDLGKVLAVLQTIQTSASTAMTGGRVMTSDEHKVITDALSDVAEWSEVLDNAL